MANNIHNERLTHNSTVCWRSSRLDTDDDDDDDDDDEK